MSTCMYCNTVPSTGMCQWALGLHDGICDCPCHDIISTVSTAEYDREAALEMWEWFRRLPHSSIPWTLHGQRPAPRLRQLELPFSGPLPK